MAILVILVKLYQLLHKLKEQIGTDTLLEKYNYLLLFVKIEFFSLINLCIKFFFPGPELEPEPVNVGPAPQHCGHAATLVQF